MKPPIQPSDPDLARFCQELADVAILCGDATDALLIDARRVHLDLDLPAGGAVLLLRFPAAATDDAAPAVTDLRAGRQPKPAPASHLTGEPPTDGEVQP